MSGSQALQSRAMASWSVNLATRFHRYKALLIRRWWIPMLTCSAAVCFQAFNVANTQPVYSSSSRMWVSPRMNLPEGAMYNEELNNFFGTQIELMQSGRVRSQAEARLRSMKPDLVPVFVNLSVAQQPKTSIFQFRAIGAQPAYTEAFLNAAMEEYMKFKDDMRETTSEKTSSAITEELVRLDKELRTGEEELMKFQRENNIVFMTEVGNQVGIQLARLNNQLSELRTEYQLLQNLTLEQNLERQAVDAKDKEKGARDPSDPNSDAMNIARPEAEYLKARQEIQFMKAEREDLSKDLKPQHPKLMKLEEQISRQERLLEIYRKQNAEQLISRRESIRLQIENLERIQTQKEAEALRVNGSMAEFQRLKSRVQRAQSLYDKLLGSMQTLGVSKSLDQETVQIMEKASVPVSTKPGVAKAIGTAFAIGLCLGIGVLLLLDRIDDRINSFVELKDHFEENVLGQIPSERNPNIGRLGLLVPEDPRHVFAESYRNVRSSLMFMAIEGERPKTILVTSAIPSEGKSTIAANLAITMAFSGSKVLLIDADLRRGALHDAFQVPNHEGLSDVLSMKKTWESAVCETGYEHLSLLPRGKTPPHPGELFLSSTTDNFIRSVYDKYDYIIFDSAPILATDDTTSLAPKMDGVLFGIRASFTSARLSRNSLDLLYQRQVNILGLIFNYVDTSLPEYYHYQYREYYSKAAQAVSRA